MKKVKSNLEKKLDKITESLKDISLQIPLLNSSIISNNNYYNPYRSLVRPPPVGGWGGIIMKKSQSTYKNRQGIQQKLHVHLVIEFNYKEFSKDEFRVHGIYFSKDRALEHQIGLNKKYLDRLCENKSHEIPYITTIEMSIKDKLPSVCINPFTVDWK